MTSDRLFTVLAGVVLHPSVKHYVGIPTELGGESDSRLQMKPAKILVIQKKEDGVFLDRYDIDGNPVGDTWHQSIDDAKYQAKAEFADLLQGWVDVPGDIEDAVVYALLFAGNK